MFGTLTDPEIEELLSKQLIGRIGCHEAGTTYVVPVSYAYDGTYIYVHSYPGKKMEIMRRHPDVCFQVDDTRNLAYWRSVIAWGRFEEIVGEKEKRDALLILQQRVLPALSSETMHLSEDWPFPPNDKEKMKGLFFRIRLDKKTGRYEKIVGEEFFAT